MAFLALIVVIVALLWRYGGMIIALNLWRLPKVLWDEAVYLWETFKEGMDDEDKK